jgi:hypothetical protein
MTCEEDFLSPIKRGFVWRQSIIFYDDAGDLPMFPAGTTYRAEIRAMASDTAAIAAMTTANGGIVRVSDTELQFVLTAAQTAAIPAGVASVVTSLVRSDVTPEEHFDFLAEIDVWTPPTRPAAP